MHMKKPKRVADSDDLRSEYDFSKGVRNKYASRVARGATLVVLDPDVAKVFVDGDAVNRALRAMIDAMPRRSRRAKRSA